MAVITISRQFGSGGDEIAAKVCYLLEYLYFDKQLMLQVAADMGLSEYEVVDFSEDTYKMRGFVDRVLSWRGPRVVAQVDTWKEEPVGTLTKEVIELDEANSVAFAQKTILAVYGYENAVIVGRGGQAILQDKPDVLHVRIEAPYAERVKRLLNRENYNPGGAKDAAIKHDRASSEYLQRFYGIDWNDTMLYDLIINTGKLSIEAAAQLIVEAARQLPQSTQAN